MTTYAVKMIVITDSGLVTRSYSQLVLKEAVELVIRASMTPQLTQLEMVAE